MRPLFALLALGVTLAGCSDGNAISALDRLHPCTTAEGPVDAYCGVLSVPENRATREGRQIDLRIILLPALGDPKPDPLFFLAGGPGQGAAAMALALREMFGRVQSDRDIVLVDQRGTGKSNLLDCRSDPDSLAALDESMDATMERLRRCAEGLDADLRLYTTSIAMDDLNDVREYLGYDKINIYGGSYGTRAALVYLRQYGETVRSVILDGVAPPDMSLPLFFPRDAQRALDRLLADCEADTPCREKYPDLGPRLRALMTSLRATPVKTRLTHPRTGVAEDITVDADFVANVLFGALYSPLTSTLLPELIVRAERHDFQGLLALALVGEGTGQNMALGMQLSVVCAEDHPRITAEQVEREAKGTIFGTNMIEARTKACSFWPRGDVDSSFYDPVKSDVPVLVLSGDLDPVTPPEWGERVLPHLSNSRHVVLPATGHGAVSTGCGMRIVQQFIKEASTANLDVSCIHSIKRPPFFVTPAGPDPARADGPSR